MRRVAIEVAGIDDEIAEQAVKAATKALSEINGVGINKLDTEPHDDTRGIWGQIDVPLPENLSPNFEQLLANAFKATILLALGPANKSASVHVTVREIEKGE